MSEFNTNLGKMDEKKLTNSLMYISYTTNRDQGMTHEQLRSIGIGNDVMKLKYENELRGIYEN